MNFTKILPSSIKSVTDKGTGLKLSPRDMTSVCSSVIPCSSLIKFGEETYNEFLDSGNLLMNIDVPDKGKGYIAYSIEDDIKVSAIYAESINQKEQFNLFDSLIETVFNNCKCLGKNLVVETEDEGFKLFVLFINQKLKENKRIEDKYSWKIG